MKIYNTKEFDSEEKKQANIIGLVLKKFYGHYDYKSSTATADDKVILTQGLDGNVVIKSIKITCDAITAAVDNDIEICKAGDTTPIKISDEKSNLLADGKSFTVALTNTEVLGSGIIDFDYSQSLKEITGVNFVDFDILLKIKTKGTVDGSIGFEIEYFDNI